MKPWVPVPRTGESVVGIAAAAVEPGSEILGIYSVYVAKEYRGLGVSRRLMEALLNRASHYPQIRISRLDVNRSQTAAQGLYRSLGYEQFMEHERRMGDGQTYSVVVMEKILHPAVR